MQGERRTVLIALAANAVIAVAKGAGGLVTGASAMSRGDGALVWFSEDWPASTWRTASKPVEELANELDRRLRETDADVDQVFLDPTTRSE